MDKFRNLRKKRPTGSRVPVPDASAGSKNIYVNSIKERIAINLKYRYEQNKIDSGGLAPDVARKSDMIVRETIHVIACGVLAQDIRRIAGKLDLDVDTTFLEGGLHENPTDLRQRLQATIDEVSRTGGGSRIAVGYGVCGRGTVGIKARGIPLVIPRVHDCISLFLGGNAAYQREFKQYPGTYYISSGWYKEKTEPLSQKRPFVWMGDRRVYFDELVEKYGEAHARETFDFLNSWKRNYQRAAFIDMGDGDRADPARYAEQMAEKYGWKYEVLKGNPDFLKALLTTKQTTAELLVVPPGQVTVFDARKEGLKARPILSRASRRREQKIEVLGGEMTGPRARLTTGLGIDAGGTYTDAVIYDMVYGKVLSKNKALTTKWDFTLGIREALEGLDQRQLPRVELTAVSTTLATNAIVEGEGQKVGLLIMPPYGLFEKGDIPNEPKAVISGRLEISGTVISPVDEAEVRRTAREMVDARGVEAFAVSGYAGAINPEHELAVKKAVIDETGCLVTCGHELSDLLNFRTRAQTAVLNARIVPRLGRLIHNLGQVLDDLGVVTPVMVVKGDGSLMSSAMAIDRPVETILSGPAASVAGAHFLTEKKNAVVVDMGGTTTDTAALEQGQVRLVESGSRVGGARTHVKALEIRTTGLGGDSLISFDEGEFTIGPRRVAPLAWLGQCHPGTERALDYVHRNLNVRCGNSRGMQILFLTDHNSRLGLTPAEARIVALLKRRPYAIEDLAKRTNALHIGFLPLARLEENYVIQRSGLTPTDLLHVTGQFGRWCIETSRRACDLFATLTEMHTEEMVVMLLDRVVRQLAIELMRKQLDMDTRPEDLESCPSCRRWVENILDGGSKNFSVQFHLHHPVIGIGAPINHFLPQAARLLHTEAILPDHADVANAIGAITSHIMVRRKLRIKPDQEGGFLIDGLAGAQRFGDLDDAETFAKEELGRIVRNVAQAAGTSQTKVKIEIRDQSARSVQGDEIFLERRVQAQLIGKPDLALAAEKAMLYE